MSHDDVPEFILSVSFFKTEGGTEPVHGFIKKSPKTPQDILETARNRKKLSRGVL
jgi:phage-related protein